MRGVEKRDRERDIGVEGGVEEREGERMRKKVRRGTNLFCSSTFSVILRTGE